MGVGRVLEQVVAGVGLTAFDLGDLRADGDDRLAEAVQLALVLALGRLDHQGVRHREGHGRGMETVIDEALGDIVHGHPARRT